MLLRIIRGNVSAGREADFVAACREQAAGRARVPGLVSFFAGYRRVAGADRFILAAAWETEEDAVRGGGEEENLTVVDVLAGIATVELVEVYTVVEPVFRGIVDAPGGVIRVTTARVDEGSHGRLMSWLVNSSRDRTRSIQRLLLGWCIGQRATGDGDELDIVAISAWPSPLVIESVADPGRTGAPLFVDVDEFTSDAQVEQFRAISLELPDELSDVGSRRLIAARFETREAADAAAAALSAIVAAPSEAQTTVAPLGEPGTASDVASFVLVARVAIAEYATAERLIGDHGGDVILSRRDSGAPAADEEAPSASFGAATLNPGFSAAQ